MFRKMRGIGLPYAVQGYIFFACQCYEYMPAGVQRKIDRTIEEVCGDYPEALRAMLTTLRPVYAIAAEYFVSDRTLYRLRKTFYEKFWES